MMHQNAVGVEWAAQTTMSLPGAIARAASAELGGTADPAREYQRKGRRSLRRSQPGDRRRMASSITTYARAVQRTGVDVAQWCCQFDDRGPIPPCTIRPDAGPAVRGLPVRRRHRAPAPNARHSRPPGRPGFRVAVFVAAAELQTPEAQVIAAAVTTRISCSAVSAGDDQWCRAVCGTRLTYVECTSSVAISLKPRRARIRRSPGGAAGRSTNPRRRQITTPVTAAPRSS